MGNKPNSPLTATLELANISSGSKVGLTIKTCAKQQKFTCVFALEKLL